MSKIGLIIGREYTTRVFKKSFILLTFLTPILLVALMAIPIWLGTIQDSNTKNIIVIDKAHLYQDVLTDNETYHFEFSDAPLEQLKKEQQGSELTGVLYITGDLATDTANVTLYAEKQANIEVTEYLSRILSDKVENQKLAAYNIPNLKEMVEESQTNIEVATIKWTIDGEEKKGSAEFALIIGIITAFIIYMFIVIYGAQVMSGVSQEKSNRIVEVIISSVKPFELMMGKIIGIALVGLTQVLLWVVLTLALSGIFTSVMGTDAQTMQSATEMTAMTAGSANVEQNQVQEIMSMLAGFDFTKLLILFVVYFLGGYLLYASLFAAIGSAVDNETDTNQFSLPLTIPIIFAIYAAMYSAQNPDGPLAFWCSLVPFTSPIVMMVRIPFDVPAWQLILSIAILVLSFIGTTWVAGKIYRTGILMYGKKITWKELWKWLRY